MNTAFLSVFKSGKATTPALMEAIVEAIDSGLLAPGDKMPSTRELSIMVGASRTTVVRAFEQLIARGYLDAVSGSATVVASARLSQNHLSAGDEQHSGRLHHTNEGDLRFPWSDRYSDTAKRLPNNVLDDLTTSADIAALQNGAVPIDLLPTKEWGRLVQSGFQMQMKLSASKEIFGYEPLRVAIAGFLRRTQGIVCQPHQIVLYSGPQSALAHIAYLLVSPGQLAVCENPGYLGAREQFRVHGARVLPVPVDKDGLITEALCSMQERVDWIHLSPSGHDPTGAILSPSRRNQLLTWCQANQTAIIEDAWDAEFHYGGDFPPPLFSKGDGVIFLYNFWRLLFPLSSIAVLVLPEDLIPLFRSAKNLSDRQFPTLEHYVLTELIESGKLEQHRRYLWKIFRKRRQSLIFELKSGLRDEVEILSPGAGMHAIVRFNADWSCDSIVRAAAKASLPLSSTHSYYCQNPVPNEFMVHFASVAPEHAKPIVEKFQANLR